MCGRFTLRPTPKELAEYFELFREPEWSPRYNIAPTQDVLAIRTDSNDASREAVLLRWGLIPSWAKDQKIGSKLINARADTVADKPSVRASFKRRRCLIAADGYFEWQQREGQRHKQPYYIYPGDEGLVAFAGLWEQWRLTDDATLQTCAIITTEANQTLSEVHNRMPVILSPGSFATWLDSEAPPDRLQELLRPAAEDLLDFREISTYVNNVRHDGPQCIGPMGE